MCLFFQNVGMETGNSENLHAILWTLIVAMKWGVYNHVITTDNCSQDEWQSILHLYCRNKTYSFHPFLFPVPECKYVICVPCSRTQKHFTVNQSSRVCMFHNKIVVGMKDSSRYFLNHIEIKHNIDVITVSGCGTQVERSFLVPSVPDMCLSYGILQTLWNKYEYFTL